ncbi:mammalian ependymin-related protein 1-like [Littorina saxatilis]|uniref:Uncharacterized protein n=1 Tax=Littorina saxatilis TaxID=31220 RepID=A0AAN9GLI7_9CAEN
MLRLALLAVLVGVALSQTPAPCITPSQFTARASQYDHKDDQMNRFYVAYDATNKRRAIFEEQNVIVPGRQFREFLEIGSENVMYEINLTLKTCTKIPMRRPWRVYGIPPNATFENEYYIGGPGEEVFAQEWSDRIPLRQREFWVGVFSLNNCYPIREVIIADYEQVNSTITTNFYDIVQGIPNPNDFLVPAECQTAEWAPHASVKVPYL